MAVCIIYLLPYFFYIQVIRIRFKEPVGYGNSQNIYIVESINCDKKIKKF